MMGRSTKSHIETHSRYCCLNSTLPGKRHPHTVINATAWCAMISTETLIGQLVYSPNRGICCPFGSAVPIF